MENRIIIVQAGRSKGKTFVAQSFAFLFDKEVVRKEAAPTITNAWLLHNSKKYNLIILEEGNQKIIDRIFRFTQKHPLKCNVVITSLDWIQDHYDERVRLIEM